MPRKTAAGGVAVGQRVVASMRPRPDATENRDSGGVQPIFGLASMRPRPDATENGFLEEIRAGALKLQ